MTQRALIAVGSNLGDRPATLLAAVAALSAIENTRVVRHSTWRETRPIGATTSQPNFLNGAVLLETSLAPKTLLTHLLAIEVSLGRRRDERWAPRSIDLDLLLYEDLVQRTPNLELPHPRLAVRRFVLEPAAEIAPDMRHPSIGWTIAELLLHLNIASNYVAISGSLFQATRALAQKVTQQTGWRLIRAPAAAICDTESEDPETSAASPSLTVEQQLKFVAEQVALLSRRQWPAGENPPAQHGAISEFWTEDLVAIGEIFWPGKVEPVWQRLAAETIAPKFLVNYESTLVASGTEWDEARKLRLTDRAARWWDILRAARLARVNRPNRGPVITLDAALPERAAVELQAAIEGMFLE